MNPYLYPREPDPVQLKDANSVVLQDSTGKDLYASGNWASSRTFNNTFGLGVLTDCISCEVTEERNGEYELAMEYPMTGWLYEYIENRCIIVAKPNATDDPQPFRVYQISRPINGVVTINARHLSYDLGGVPVGSFTASGSRYAIAFLKALSAVPHPFSFHTDIISAAPFTVDVPSSVRSWFGGKEGSLIDVYGGEWHYDIYTCTLMSSRGQDNGEVIKYGVNMIDFKQEENLSNMFTGILPYWVDNQTGETVTGYILHAEGSFDFEKILSVDLTSDFSEKPNIEELTARGRQYIKENNIGVPEVNITVEWVPTMGNVELCDTVTVSFEKIGIEATAKCVRAVYDVLKERYSVLEIGNVKPTIADNIAYLNRKVGYRV